MAIHTRFGSEIEMLPSPSLMDKGLVNFKRKLDGKIFNNIDANEIRATDGFREIACAIRTAYQKKNS